MTAKEKVQRRHIGAYAKKSQYTARWLIMRPVGTGSYTALGQGNTAREAWQDAAVDC